MKTIKKIGLMAFTALALVLTSCSSDSDGGSSSVPGTGTYVNAKVDGAAFTTLSVQGHTLGAAVKSGTGTSTYISVTGSAAESLTATNIKTINLLLMGITTTGTYTINADSESIVSYVDSALEKSWDTSNCSGTTATVIVTTLNDSKIEGTFSFTGADDDNCSSKKVVTEGSFRGEFVH